MDSEDVEKTIYKFNTLEIDLTYRCSYNCFKCDRACGAAPTKGDISVEQVEETLSEITQHNLPVTKLVLIGGEPTFHPHITEIIRAVEKFRTQHDYVQVCLNLSNTMNHRAQKIIRLIPKELISTDRWHISSKEKVGNNPEHAPFMMAALDLGVFEKDKNPCNIPITCGANRNLNGWHVCSPGATVDRIFGLNLSAKTAGDLTMDRIGRQLDSYCGLCGYYLCFKNITKHNTTPVEPISISWKRALATYNGAR